MLQVDCISVKPGEGGHRDGNISLNRELTVSYQLQRKGGRHLRMDAGWVGGWMDKRMKMFTDETQTFPCSGQCMRAGWGRPARRGTQMDAGENGARVSPHAHPPLLGGAPRPPSGPSSTRLHAQTCPLSSRRTREVSHTRLQTVHQVATCHLQSQSPQLCFQNVPSTSEEEPSPHRCCTLMCLCRCCLADFGRNQHLQVV